MSPLHICCNILEGLKSLIDSPSFLAQFHEKHHFIRKRKLTISQVILYLLYTSKASMNLNLSNIRDDLKELHFPELTKQALSKARLKLKPLLFKTLFLHSVETFYASSPSRKKWNGYHVFAIDGSCIQVPKTKDNISYFGLCKNKYHSREDSMACISILYDVMEDMVVDGVLHPYHYAERRSAMEHLSCLESIGLKDKTVVLFDRGYPSYEFYRHFDTENYFFAMRIQSAVKSLTQLSSKDEITQYHPSYIEDGKTVQVRVLHVELDDGTDECIVTNILDPAMTPAMFKELYFRRWKIESKYHELKNQLELEEFSGAVPTNVEQDFFIHLLFMNLCALLKSEADEKIRQEKKKRNYEYQANRAYIIGRLKKHLARLLSGGETIPVILAQFVKEAVKKRSQIQPNRTSKRPRIQLRHRHCKNRKTTM